MSVKQMASKRAQKQAGKREREEQLSASKDSDVGDEERVKVSRKAPKGSIEDRWQAWRLISSE